MAYWLMKSEPAEVSIDDLAASGTVPWFGVRNYQARNFMRDAMRVGDLAFFYHSSCAEPGIAGVCEVCAPAHADATQFDPASPYFDPKATPDLPRWLCVDVKFVAKTRLLPLAELRASPELAGMPLLQRGNRLSITPVTPVQWAFIMERLSGRPPRSPRSQPAEGAQAAPEGGPASGLVSAPHVRRAPRRRNGREGEPR